MGNTICGAGVGDDLPLLPEEVWIQILLWLPVISLLRFKSICKSWRDLIQSSFFIDLHTSTTFNSSSNLGSFILQTAESSSWATLRSRSVFMPSSSSGSGGSGGGGGGGGGGDDEDSKVEDKDYWVRERKMFMLSFRSGSGGGGGGGEDDDEEEDQVVFKLDKLWFPSSYKAFPPIHSIRMVGSCNGLICLHDSDLRVVSLWNPATRQVRVLPKSITIKEKEEEVGKFLFDFVAFGLDVKTKDYKVLQITNFKPTCIAQWGPECICRVQVYSLSTDSWRLLEGIKSLPARPNFESFYNHGLYLNNSYFFVGIKCPSLEEPDEEGERVIRNNSLMVSFDFTREIFTTMQFPDHDDRQRLVLSYLGERIALFTTIIKVPLSEDEQYHCDSDDFENYDICYEDYDIWVLNEQGGSDVNKESWTKLHSFRLRRRGASWILPRRILNNGKFVLVESKTNYGNKTLNKLHLLNLVTKEAKKNFPICDRVLRVEVYKQSLVSIIGGNGTTTANRVVGGAMCGC